jgi:death-on-curing protein
VSTQYISVTDILYYHAKLLREQGQPQAPLIAPDRLESAVERPQTTLFGDEMFPSLAEKGAALLQAILVGHPFLDGNKRAGLAAVLLFMELNGVLPVESEQDMYDLTIAVATGELREVSDIAPRVAAIFGL